jgi:hypothetical protein
MKTFNYLSLLKAATLLLVPGLILTGCMTSSKEGSLAAAGLVYEQRGESTAKIDGEQLAKLGAQVVEIAGKAEKALTVGGQASSLLDTVKDMAKGAADTASKAKDQAAGASHDAADAKKDATDAKEESKSAAKKADALAAELGINKVQLEAARKTLEQLDSDTKVKLQNVSADQIRELAKLKDDREKFNDEFRKTLEALKLDQKQIANIQEKTKGMSTQEILAILAAAGTAGAAGIASARTGKSRSQPEIDALKSKVTELDHTTEKKKNV